MKPRFRDRFDAGRQLASHLTHYANRPETLVLGLPRGGVPVAYEVSHQLRVPLDVFVVRKLGVPGHEELAMGAIATGGTRWMNDEITRTVGVTEQDIERAVDEEMHVLNQREHAYRGDAPPPSLHNRSIILIDDGLATGATMQVAVRAIRKQHPAQTIVAVPVAASEACDQLRAMADEMICLSTPDPFNSVGLWYQNFAQTTDDEVHDLMQRAASHIGTDPE